MCIESAHKLYNKYCMNCIVSQNLKFIVTVINWREREREKIRVELAGLYSPLIQTNH